MAPLEAIATVILNEYLQTLINDTSTSQLFPLNMN